MFSQNKLVVVVGFYPKTENAREAAELKFIVTGNAHKNFIIVSDSTNFYSDLVNN